MNKMTVWLCVVLCMLLPGSSKGDNVTQTPLELHVIDGAQAIFNCKYQTLDSNPDLFWYLQEPGMSPRAIIHRAAHKNIEKDMGIRYESKLDKDKKSIYLRIPDVRVSDSGLYYCALRATVSVFVDCSVQEASRSFVLNMINPIFLRSTDTEQDKHIHRSSNRQFYSIPILILF
uniref:Ig-like domain-containing protein n=1 Tax=Leptobrachium leishanense TaxID=445787 RepID=A0A8C5M3F8_9ANUR